MARGTAEVDIRPMAVTRASTRPMAKEIAVSGIVTLIVAQAMGQALSLTRSQALGAALSAEKYLS